MTLTPKHAYFAKKNSVSKELKNVEGQISIKKKTSNLFGNRVLHTRDGLDLRSFNSIIFIDEKKLTAEVEGLVTYEELVKATLQKGLVPTIAPELKSITVGGAYAGVGIESSTFRYGFMHETVLETDIITGKGIITCNANENKDLFFAFPNSYGTLGYAIRLVIKLIPAKKYVKIERERFDDIDEYTSRMGKLTKQNQPKGPLDYIDGLIFGEHEMYVIKGTFTDTPKFVSSYTGMDIYYKSVRTKTVDYLTTFEYIFRYDTDWFWNSKAFGLENKFLRALVPKNLMRSDVYYKIMRFENKHKIFNPIKHFFGAKKTEQVSQDAEVVIEKAPEFVRFFLKEICDDIPLVYAPAKAYNPKAKFALWPNFGDEIRMNIGFYAPIPTTHPSGYFNRLYDKKVISLSAFKMLYSDVYMTSKEFWSMFDKKTYDEVKKKYDPKKQFRDLYEKCTSRQIK